MFDAQLQFIDQFENNLFKEFEKAVNEFDFVMKDYIVNKQLFRRGIDGNEKRLTGYVRTTIRIKRAKGDPTDRTTLRDSGDFYAHIEVTGTPQYFVISSDVPYDENIIRRYGKDVLKISNENMYDFMTNYFLPNLKQYANNILTK